MKTIRYALAFCVAFFGVVGCNPQPAQSPVGTAPAPTEGAGEPTAAPVLTKGKTVVADGELASPYPSLALGFQGGVGGQVLTITVKAGDILHAGDLIAVLDDAELLRAVDDARRTLDRAGVDREHARVQWERDVADAEQALLSAQRTLTSTLLQSSETSLEEARRALERAQQAEADAKKAYETPLFGQWTPPEQQEQEYRAWQNAIRERELAEMRYKDALDSRGVGALDIEARRADAEKAERALTALQDGVAPSYERAVEDAQQQLVKAEEALRNARLIAPWTAIVLSVNMAPRATIATGASVVTLLNVEDGLRFVTQNLSEQHVSDIRPGQRAVVTLRTFAETPLEGAVEALVPQEKTASANDARFTVYVRLAPTETLLLPGYTGRVEIFTGE